MSFFEGIAPVTTAMQTLWIALPFVIKLVITALVCFGILILILRMFGGG